MCGNKTAMEDVLSSNIMHQKQRARTDNTMDARECHDCLAHQTTIISPIKHGAPETGATSRFDVLQQLECKVQTAHGVSKSTHGGPKRKRKGQHCLQSIGQGNGGGPTSFGTLGTDMINVMRKK